MADRKLASVPQLKASAKAWFQRLLLIAVSFLGYLAFPGCVAGIYLGESYKWVFQVVVLMLPLTWTVLRACTVVRNTIKNIPAEFKPVLEAVDDRTLRYEGYTLNDPVLKRMIEAGWLEHPSTETDHDGNPPVVTYVFKITETAMPYFLHLRRTPPKSEQTR